MRVVSPTEYWDGGREGAELVDVRTPAEFGEVHAEGARLVPPDRLEPASFVGGGRRVYPSCQSGQRAAQAGEKLVAAGVEEVYCIEGGTATRARRVNEGAEIVVLERGGVYLVRELRAAVLPGGAD